LSTIVFFVFVVKDRHFDNLVLSARWFYQIANCIVHEVNNALVLFLEVIPF
jgi:hypothetical protein